MSLIKLQTLNTITHTLMLTYFCVRFLLAFISPTQHYYLYAKWWLHNVIMRNIKRLMAENCFLYTDYLVNNRYAARMAIATWFTLKGLQYRIPNIFKKLKDFFPPYHPFSGLHVLKLYHYRSPYTIPKRFSNWEINCKGQDSAQKKYFILKPPFLKCNHFLFDESNICWFAIWKTRFQFIYYGYISFISKYRKPWDYYKIWLYILLYTHLNHWICMQLIESHFREKQQHMGLLPDTQYCGLCMRRKCRERFTHHRLSRHASRHVRHARAVMHAGIAYWRFPLKSVAGKTFPGFPAHAQPAILRIW